LGAPQLFSLFLAGGLLHAQDTREVAGTRPAGPAAAVRLAELERRHLARAGKGNATRERVDDLRSFVSEFPRSPEAGRARFEIAELMFLLEGRFTEAGKEALKALELPDVELKAVFQAMLLARSFGTRTEQMLPRAAEKFASASVQTTLHIAAMAMQMGLEDEGHAWMKQALAKATSLDDRLDAARGLRLSLPDEDGWQSVLAEADKVAKSPDERARVLMEKVSTARHRKRGDEGKEEARAILQEIVNLYPSSPTGRIAKGQLAVTEIAPGREAIPFLARDLNGKWLSLGDYEGKVLLIVFWATWCGPSMMEMPLVVRTYDEFRPKGFEVVGIALDKDADREKVESVVAKNKMAWRHVLDGVSYGSEIAQLYGLEGTPFTVLVGRGGKVIASDLRGSRIREEARRAVQTDR
jgi:thiol-disulfide isomerase/thioredoxin